MPSFDEWVHAEWVVHKMESVRLHSDVRMVKLAVGGLFTAHIAGLAMIVSLVVR